MEMKQKHFWTESLGKIRWKMLLILTTAFHAEEVSNRYCTSNCSNEVEYYVIKNLYL